MLDILSQSKEPQKIQVKKFFFSNSFFKLFLKFFIIFLKPHLNKCFGNINGLEVSTKLLEITHLISSEGEKLEIAKPIRVRGATEQWLGKLSKKFFSKKPSYFLNYFIYSIGAMVRKIV